MAGAVPAQNLPGTAATNEASGSGKTTAQAMMDLMREMSKIVATRVTAENQEEINVELTKLSEEMAKVQRHIDIENARMTELQARINNESKRLKAEAWQLKHHGNASDAVHHRRHRTGLPVDLDPTHLFVSSHTSEVEREPPR